jgi:putative transcriptional regulator
MKKKANTKAKPGKLETGLLKGLREAIAFEETKINLRTKTIEIPDLPPDFSKFQVKEVREELNVSQPIFAKILGVSDDTVKAWERGANKPSGSSARLIQIAKKDPRTFKRLMMMISR